MASSVTEILEDLVTVLRATGKFRLVTLGHDPTASDVPRASVVYEGQESIQPDDSSTSRLVRIRAGISVHTRSAEPSEALRRINELCDEVISAILEDRFRGGRCEDLPPGRATELGRIEQLRGLKRPEIEVVLSVRCHLEVEEGAQ